MSKIISRSIASASVVVILFTLLGRGLGLVREIVFASVYGAGSQFDFFLLIAAIPLVLNNTFIYLGQNYFVPMYHKIYVVDKESKTAFLSGSLKKFFFGGLLLSVLLFTIQKIFNFNDVKLAGSAAGSLFTGELLLYATIPLAAVFSIAAAYLQAEFNFIIPAVAQISLNLSIIAFVVLFGSSDGFLAIINGYFWGYFLQAVLVFIYIYFVKRVDIFRKNKKQVVGAVSLGLTYIILIEVLNQSYTIIDRYFINMLPEGGVSALNYAFVIYTAPIGIISLAFSSAVLPFFSKSSSLNDFSKLSGDLIKSLKILAAVFIPVMFILYFWGGAIVALLYRRGNFGSSNVELTSDVLKYLSISLIFFASFAVINKVFYSMSLLKTLLIVSLTAVVIKLILNFLLVEELLQSGLALSSSITYIIITVSAFVILAQKIKLKGAKEYLISVALSFFIAFASLLTVHLVNSYIFETSPGAIISIPLFLFIYAFISYFADTNEIEYIKSALQKKSLRAE